MPFKIDGNTLTNQPSRTEVSYEDPKVKYTIDGSYKIVQPSAKRRVRVTWGVAGTRQAVTTELEELRTDDIVSVTFVKDGSEETISEMYFPRVPYSTIPGGDALQVPAQAPLTLEFFEL